MLTVENITKIYKKGSSLFKKDEDFVALNKISFKLEQNKVLSIIGESGSGKTTLAKIICSLLPYDSGKIEINNKNISNYTKKELSNTVQMIFQNPYASFNPKLTIGYSLTEAADDTVKDKREYIKEKLALVDMPDDILNKFPHQFSGGQRQRIAIARALLKEPKLLIADEPFASLDVINQSLIMDIFRKIKKEHKTNIIFITHDISSAFQISDKILILQNGNMVKYGDIEDIKNDKSNSYINELINATYLTD
ncbi:MAG: dipeptide/oligopeptide/nickel ABC transporter ATP-binding protein [Endomicrobiaceae bacterium]|nr:dipeptide/oligopeptide/nickel ABC transporter ATP-binding protein [Endomicrobiaceae bacterium]